MRAAILVALLIVAPPCRADDKAVWLDRARAIVVRHHLLSRADLKCTILVYGVESTATMAGISALERHGHGCPGDPQTSPRMFTLDIDKTTGSAMWDRDDRETMKPVP